MEIIIIFFIEIVYCGQQLGLIVGSLGKSKFKEEMFLEILV